MTVIILASTSGYRAQLLRRVVTQFSQVAPGIDEAHVAGELPDQRATRLATDKAIAVAQNYPDHVIIGSDQVASLNGKLLDKPGNVNVAKSQLKASSGQTVCFHTSVCVARYHQGRLSCASKMDVTRARFRCLSDAAITRYLEAETPFDCAGSFKCESLGISLFTSIDNHDPTALIGLPLIATCALLRDFGMDIP